MIRDTMNYLTTRQIARGAVRAAVSCIAALGIAGGILVCVGLSALTKENAGNSTKTASINIPNLIAQPRQTSDLGSLHVVQFTLYDVGIYPREVRVSRGLIALSIEDLSGGTSGLIIERKTVKGPDRLSIVQRAANSMRGRGEINLGPGNYSVYMADRPDNRALMIVTP